MTMSFNWNGFDELEGIYRDFLWGTNELGDVRTALVAWEDTALTKVEGGVGFDNFKSTSLILKMHWYG